MHLLDRIDAAIDNTATRIDPAAFERFALDRLTPHIPTLAPMPGGSDWGRDGDIPAEGDGTPTRVLVTSSRTLKGVRENMRGGLKSLQQHEVAVERVVLVNLARLSASDVSKLQKSADEFGVTVLPPYGREWVASQLRTDGEWRQRLLGIPGDPIGISPLPPDLAASPWVRLPLVGRKAELAELVDLDGRDIVLSGQPGSGKSRLLSELSGAAFVDRDARVDVVLDDLRVAAPSVVVIDDAAERRDLVRQIVRARHQGPDLMSFRVIAVCWPDEIEDLQDDLRDAAHMQLDLLEQGAVDEVVRAMGIHGRLARSEILSQAEGRPGWAVALGDVLLASGDPADLLSGRALRGEVHRYLRRRALGDASDLLAVMATLGEVGEDELAAVADEIDLPRRQMRRLLERAATSGLVDVRRSWAGDVTRRTYLVRPPMLAAALVAERVFETNVSAIDPVGLFDRWPTHSVAVVHAAIEAARLGATGARLTAERFYDRVTTERAVGADAGAGLARTFGFLDRSAAQHVLDRLLPEFESILASDRSNKAYALSPYVAVASDLAPWKLPVAMRILLDAALIDDRETHPFPTHPLRQVSELITSFHPDVPQEPGLPTFLITAADEWLGTDANDRRWGVWAHAAAVAMSPKRSGAYSEPGRPMSVSLFETVARPEQSTEIADEVWPIIADRLRKAPSRALVPLIEGIEDWLRVGAGFDEPFGQAHGQEVIDTAASIGARMLRDMADQTDGRPGICARLARLVADYSADVLIQAPSWMEPFLVEMSVEADWRTEVERIRRGIEEATDGWHNEPPEEIVARLVEMRDELDLAGHAGWPPRIRLACEAIADRGRDLRPWVDASLDQGLLPDAEPLLFAYERSQHGLPPELISRGIGKPESRWPVARAVLTDVDASEESVAAVMARLEPSDLPILEELVRDAPLRQRVLHILTSATPDVRAAMAVAMAEERSVDEDWTPGDFEDEWLEALSAIGEVTGRRDDDLYRWIARRYPDRFVELLEAALPVTEDDRKARIRPPHAMRDAVSSLPEPHKAALLKKVTPEHAGRRLLLKGLVRGQIGWLDTAIEDGDVTADEVAMFAGTFELETDIEELARIVVPRGVEPAHVAQLAEAGTWWGEASDRYQRIADRFERMAGSDDDPVAQVGRAGHLMFTKRAEEARAQEKRERILGHR